MRIVLANGCFDRFHDGHLRHLEEAKAMGDILVVSVTEDRFVNKGPDRPVNNLARRLKMVRALRCVDAAFSCISATEAILRVKPYIFVKGIDYAGGDRFSEDVARACEKVSAEIRYTTAPKQVAP